MLKCSEKSVPRTVLKPPSVGIYHNDNIKHKLQNTFEHHLHCGIKKHLTYHVTQNSKTLIFPAILRNAGNKCYASYAQRLASAREVHGF